MPDYTIPTLGARFSETLDYWNTFIDQYRAWLGGTADGGPNQDGKYPLTNGLGVTYLLECPSVLANTVTGPAGLAIAAKIAAEAAVSIAQTHAVTAENQKTLAETARSAAQAARTTAETARDNALSSAAAAQTHAELAQSIAEELTDAVAQLEASTETLEAAVATQAALANSIIQSQDAVTAANAAAQAALISIQAANTNVNAARANVTTQAQAVATANTSVTANLALAQAAVSNAVAARDIAIGARDAAQAANTSAQQAVGQAAAHRNNAASFATNASTSATSAANSAALALQYRDEAAGIVGGDYVANSAKASNAEAAAATLDHKWMTPATTRHAVHSVVGQNVTPGSGGGVTLNSNFEVRSNTADAFQIRSAPGNPTSYKRLVIGEDNNSDGNLAIIVHPWNEVWFARAEAGNQFPTKLAAAFDKFVFGQNNTTLVEGGARGKALIREPTDGGAEGFGFLVLGKADSAGAGWKVTSTASGKLQARLGDDSASAPAQASILTGETRLQIAGDGDSPIHLTRGGTGNNTLYVRGSGGGADFRNIDVGNVLVSYLVQPQGRTYAQLTALSAPNGSIAYCTDPNSTTSGSFVTAGGGSTGVLVQRFSGNWRVI